MVRKTRGKLWTPQSPRELSCYSVNDLAMQSSGVVSLLGNRFGQRHTGRTFNQEMGGWWNCTILHLTWLRHSSIEQTHAHFCDPRCLTPTITHTFALGRFITPVKHTCFKEAGVDRNHVPPFQSAERQEETRRREVWETCFVTRGAIEDCVAGSGLHAETKRSTVQLSKLTEKPTNLPFLYWTNT